MDPLLITAASGMKARMDSLDMLANNMANSGTAGFKSDREFYNLYEQPLPMVERQYTDFSQGQMLLTGNPLNVALNGKGFFALNSPGGVVYTRAGNFQCLHDEPTGDPRRLHPAQRSRQRQADHGRPQTADRHLEGRHRPPGRPGSRTDRNRAAGVAVRHVEETRQHVFRVDRQERRRSRGHGYRSSQGQLEQSNVPVADSAVKLVSVMRQFEMMQKAMTLGTEMNKQAIYGRRETQLRN